MHYFNTKLSYQKPMLRQAELWVQNGPVTNQGVLSVATFFENFKRLSFIWRFFLYEYS